MRVRVRIVVNREWLETILFLYGGIFAVGAAAVLALLWERLR